MKNLLTRHFICRIIGHKFKFKMTAIEGDKLFRCARCGLDWWTTGSKPLPVEKW